MDRRRFLELTGMGLCSGVAVPSLKLDARESNPSASSQANGGKTYGSGHFGEWISDSFGLPAYRYTCNQITDPKAFLPLNQAWRSPTDHIHQVGNSRIVAIASNYGHIQVRQDEGSPKFLNDFFPEQSRYGGGIGFLSDGDLLLSAYYSGQSETFDRTFGVGYLRKRVARHPYEVDQVIFAPFGDDPVLISQVTIRNQSDQAVSPRWVEYWGCHNYQFSYRSLMEAGIAGSADAAPRLRREFSERFTHSFRAAKNRSGLIESQQFQGRSPEEEAAWVKVQAALKADPTQFYGGPVPPLAPGAAMEDTSPPSTFLVSLDAPADGFSTNATKFFRGSIDHPSGATQPLDNDLNTSGPESAFFLERRLTLKPGESRTMYFLYGYLPEGFDFDGLMTKYSENPSALWPRSSSQWKTNNLLFRTSAEPWVERETAWSGYYLRSGLSYDSYFQEHILSQGAGYQYLAGLQGAARDPLQHVLPLIFTDPGTVREVLRYTLKEIQPDGSLPYGIVGSGVPMPCVYRPSDLQLWVLWLASEYVLATRDKAFLNSKVSTYPRSERSTDQRTVRELLSKCYEHLISKIGVGQHGLLRLLNGDWNDSIVVTHLTPAQAAEVRERTESVLNAAMAAYVFCHYARMLEFAGDRSSADETRTAAEQQRQAVRAQWTGRWFRRAWLGEQFGWVGEKQMWLETQPWAILGGCATPDQLKTLVPVLNEMMRKPSPIGALLQSEADPTMKDEPGTGTNGGVFAAINATLIWALAQVNGDLAWDEWKKNTLARHADVYPDMWFGIWSGPDAYHSVLAKNAGGTGPDFPVLNMHSHAWPLYTAAKLVGLEFYEKGLAFRPLIPLPEYEFASKLVGFKKSADGYSGWYAPAIAGVWNIDLNLPDADRHRILQISVNGSSVKQESKGTLQLSGKSRPDQPLAWKITLRT